MLVVSVYRVDNLVEANITWVSRGSQELFNVVPVAESPNGPTATATVSEKGERGISSQSPIRVWVPTPRFRGEKL